ncbi:MAG: endonuclease III [Erysipelotrichaceae bacterium]|nr:endonuclease III [Erysipelotrichaceae bacterium]
MTDKAIEIIEVLNQDFKDAKCALNYRSIYELLVAVMLSAQTTDAKVNKVTASLFSTFPTIESIANAKKEEIEPFLFPLGLSKIKTNNLIKLSEIILTKYNGIVPTLKDDLLTLPGVGNKTTEVILAEGYKIPAFPVDTHVHRISKRLGLVSEDCSVLETEKFLKSFFDEEHWIRLHHQMIFFGRQVCLARNPKCEKCRLKKFCTKNHNKS